MADEHLRGHDYGDDGTGRSALVLAHRMHHHLIDACPECHHEWLLLGGLQEPYLSILPGFRPPQPASPPDDDNDLLVDDAALARQDEYVAQVRRLRRRAFDELRDLRRTPPDQRAGKIRAARRRFQGRELAELLIEESRSRVRTAPEEALHWIELVPTALAWTREGETPAWAPALLARAAAHRANALRLLGDRPAARQAFADLGRSLAEETTLDSAVVAEITRLWASLEIAEQHSGAFPEERIQRCALASHDTADTPVHVCLDDYILVLRGMLPGVNEERLLQEAHQHLMDVCPTCRRDWEDRPRSQRR